MVLSLPAHRLFYTYLTVTVVSVFQVISWRPSEQILSSSVAICTDQDLVVAEEYSIGALQKQASLSGLLE